MLQLDEQFVKSLSEIPGHERVIEALTAEPSPVCVRLNPAKSLREEIPAETRTVPWEPCGFYLEERPRFTFMPSLYDGHFYVQDASSMIVGEVVRRLCRDGQPLRVLDACAAPGGKALSALSALPEGSFVLANEFKADRIPALADNLNRWGLPAFAVAANDARRLHKLGAIFDIAVADVPCSGEGMMRKNETAVTQWSPRLVAECASLQREILSSVWSTLRPGGYLVYSTCTFNTVENEDNVSWIVETLGAEPVDLNLTDYPGVCGPVKGLLPVARLMPGFVDGEGQFVAVLRKPSDAADDEPRMKKAKAVPALPDWINPGFAEYTDKTGRVFAFPEVHADLMGHIMSKIHVAVPGTHIANPKGRGLVPAHALATSLALRNDVFPTVNVDYPTAIRFLQGNSIELPRSTPKGIVLIVHDGNRLGWANNIGNRANNLVPNEYRIRSPYVPDSCPALF